MNRFWAGDFLLEVAKGKVDGHSIIHKVGENISLDTADGYGTIWDYGPTRPVYTWSSSADGR